MNTQPIDAFINAQQVDVTLSTQQVCGFFVEIYKLAAADCCPERLLYIFITKNSGGAREILGLYPELHAVTRPLSIHFHSVGGEPIAPLYTIQIGTSPPPCPRFKSAFFHPYSCLLSRHWPSWALM